MSDRRSAPSSSLQPQGLWCITSMRRGYRGTIWKRRAHLICQWVTRSLSQGPSFGAGRKQALLNGSTQRCRGTGGFLPPRQPLCGPSGGTSRITTEMNFNGNKSTKWKPFLSSVNSCRPVHPRPLLRGQRLEFSPGLKFGRNLEGLR